MVVSLEWVGLKQTCSYETSDHILSLAYIFFLIILVSGLSIKYKHIKDNYKEAYSIFFLMVLTVPTWIAWVSASLLLPAVYSRAAFGQFLFIFQYSQKNSSRLNQNILFKSSRRRLSVSYVS